MPAFNYVAITAAGKQKKGTIEADSDRQIRQQLRDQGLIPVEVQLTVKKEKQLSAVGGDSLWAQLVRSTGGVKLSTQDLALITRQLATLIQAALPVEEALKAVAKQATKAKVRGIALALRSKVNEGFTLANALSEFPNAFPDLYRATVAAGEHSGHLDLVLNQLADYTESSSETQRKVKGALVYPVILMFFSIGILVALMVFVVPQIVEVISDNGQEVPPLTAAVIAVSNFLVHQWHWLVLLLVLGFAAIKFTLHKEQGRYKAHQLILKLPLFGRLSRGLNAARICNTLSILSGSGVQLVEALRISGEVTSNVVIQKGVQNVADRVREGGSLYRSLDQFDFFPPMMVQMIASGENSGDLDKMLHRAAQNQDREMLGLIATILSLFEPLVMVFMGITVMIIVMAVMLPIFNMSNVV